MCIQIEKIRLFLYYQMNMKFVESIVEFERRIGDTFAGKNSTSEPSEDAVHEVIKGGKGWEAGTIDHKNVTVPEGGRTLEQYQNALGFSESDLNDKVILDLGAGSEVKIATELRERDCGAKVFELSPDFMFQKYRNTAIISAARKYQTKLMGVAGLLNDLPFVDETFDTILVFHVAEHIHNKEIWQEGIMDICRVLKHGGKAFIGPTSPKMRYNETTKSWEFYDPHYEALVKDEQVAKFLDEQGVTLRLEDLPDSDENRVKVYIPDMGAAQVFGRYLSHRIILEK